MTTVFIPYADVLPPVPTTLGSELEALRRNVQECTGELVLIVERADEKHAGACALSAGDHDYIIKTRHLLGVLSDETSEDHQLTKLQLPASNICYERYDRWNYLLGGRTSSANNYTLRDWNRLIGSRNPYALELMYVALEIVIGNEAVTSWLLQHYTSIESSHPHTILHFREALHRLGCEDAAGLIDDTAVTLALAERTTVMQRMCEAWDKNDFFTTFAEGWIHWRIDWRDNAWLRTAVQLS